jgi:imidazole glycerol-phosphate synthase subunit HisF
MLKKRLIFTLLFDNGHYMLSRNFRLQRVGDLQWLKKNYHFASIAGAIDELVILNVNANTENQEQFCEHIRELTKDCFMPIAAGGGIRDISHARSLLNSGADKIVLNTVLYTDELLVKQLAQIYGKQCLVASVDIKSAEHQDLVYIENGKKQLLMDAATYIAHISQFPIGELYLNSIDRDGTGQGYQFGLLKLLPENNRTPIILAGGAGNRHHFEEGLSNPIVDAVATAHLFNFVGNGLVNARDYLISNDANLAKW